MRVTGSVLALPFSDIDTDQIIPAAHLTTVEREGLGGYLFDGQAELTRRLEAAPGATIVVALENFGSGSSREHAVWALVQRGFRVVIARSFSRIFLENAYNNGLVPVELPEHDARVCLGETSLDIDVANEVITLPDGARIAFALDPLRKLFLLDGGYLRFLHGKVSQIREWSRCRV
ncbi:MAG: 3-isopropylmalate dehydratase small subunit [Vulcanimicrobiaceae bacterium]